MSFIITKEGECYVSGHNAYGTLGLGDTTNINRLTKTKYNALDITMYRNLLTMFLLDDG